MLLKNAELDNLVISAKGATIGTTKVDVMEVKDGDNTIYLFKADGKFGTTVTEVLPKTMTKQNIVAALDSFGDKGVELLGKGMNKFGKVLVNWAGKISK